MIVAAIAVVLLVRGRQKKGMGEQMKNKSGELNGFLDHGSSFRGELEFEDTMRIDGRFNGKIMSKNELIVGESAHIEGDVHVGRIAISGTIVGKIVAAQRVEIHRNGKVYSDIETPALIIEEGAIFQGNCVMGEKKPATVTNIAAKA
ncbi:MAG TPA: polymer-forming cytoskeletal protein [Thermoanaerobaculia bacterium]|nr:polymer-forming cytoskeletal protein [Thermoanaerobaculia bacterium]